MFDKLFGRGKKKEEAPEPLIPFGRYSDNNKPVEKVNRWTEADNLFKQKNYPESLDAFFNYLSDDELGNVSYQRSGSDGRFSLYQGSKIVRGDFNAERLTAEVTLAKMPQPSVPVMRRLLEMNFNLYYSRFALDGDRLCMRFDSDMTTTAPSKLYYGLKELATRADKQDDLLVQDFAALQMIDTEHVQPIPAAEKEVKYAFFRKWIQEVLDQCAGLDPEKFAGGISYMLLSLIYRLDYLISPEGQLLRELEKTGTIYFAKDERPATEKNRDMIESFKLILARSKEEVFACLFRSKYTFAIVPPQPHKVISDAIHAANQNMPWYRENGNPFVAGQVTEYGLAFCQYSYSLPRILTELFHLYMRVSYAGYFEALGFQNKLYDEASTTFDREKIVAELEAIRERWKSKYPNAVVNPDNLRFDNLVNFGQTFATEFEFLNMES